MQQNNNLSPLPFYGSLAEQNHRLSYAYGECYPLHCEVGVFLPFQIIKDSVIKPLRVELYRKNGEFVTYLLDLMSLKCWKADNGLVFYTYSDNPQVGDVCFSYSWIGGITYHSGNVVRKNGENVNYTRYSAWDMNSRIKRMTAEGFNGEVIVYPATSAISISLSEGEYYIVIKEDLSQYESGQVIEQTRYTWYSEVFTMVADVSGLCKLEWYDEENFVFGGGAIIYVDEDEEPYVDTQTGEQRRNIIYRNYLYLATEVGKPNYTFTEEAEDRDGYNYPTKQISEKTYKINFVAPEYLCDVLRLTRIADHKRITDQYGRKYVCDTFLPTMEWEEQGDLADVTCEFDTDTIMKQVGKICNAMDGDYSENDFNNDYSLFNNN